MQVKIRIKRKINDVNGSSEIRTLRHPVARST
jgi:hypothetical protein